MLWFALIERFYRISSPPFLHATEKICRNLFAFNNKNRVLGTMHAYNYGLCPGQESSAYAGGHPPVRDVKRIAHSNRCLPEIVEVEPQSRETYSTNLSDANILSQNVEFMDANPAYDYRVEGSSDPTRACADTADAELGSFFERPILIDESAWVPGMDFYHSFNPWALFFNDPRNVNRLANFNLLRSRLCVKFVINGNGFYYGRLLASYNPLPSFDQVTLNRGLGISVDSIGESQKPHVYINPTECQGGTLCLPFIHYQNAIRIPTAQWEEMGTVTVRTLNMLKNVNVAPSVVGQQLTLSVFAWAEDVDLSVPTAANPLTIVPQGMEVVAPQSDEYGDTPVSTVASTVARVAGKLTNVPFIGKFARATQIGAGAIGDLGKLFGFSRPPIIDPIQVYVPRFVGGLANVNTPDAVNKLSLDVKQEVTVDPSVTGVSSADEMGIVALAKRQSYYTTFRWETTGNPNSGPGTKLFQTQVMPTVYQKFLSGAETEYHLMPCGMMALPFRYWGGSMEFRFQIVSSNFHRGRLRIVWDPHSLDGGGSSSGYNTMYTRIVDIADMRDFTFKVGWGKEYSFLPVRNPMKLRDGLPVPSYATGSMAPAILQEVFGNGTISVFVVNDLTTPSPDPDVDASVEVNVFVNMCDDARFAAPTDLALSNVSYFPVPPPEDAQVVPQSDEQVAEVQLSAPDHTDVVASVGASGETTDHTMDVFFGEQVVSIRELLKRYCLHSGVITGSYANETYGSTLNLKQPDFPYYKGYCPNGPHTSVKGKYAYSHMTFLNYFTPAFVAYRGGIRWKYLCTRNPTLSRNGDDGSVTVLKDVYGSVTRSDGISQSLVTYGAYAPYSYSSGQSIFRDGSNTGFNNTFPHAINVGTQSEVNGAYVAPVQLNPSMEVELPFYTNRRFFNARRINVVDNRGLHDETPPVHELQVTGAKCAVLGYVAAAEDFSLSFFTGVPVMYSLGRHSSNAIPGPAN